MATEKHPVSADVVIGRDHFKTTITTGSHHLVADEPAELQGTDLGPNPYQLLLASLGTCTVITVRMYADMKGFPVDQIKVHLTHDKQERTDSKGKKEVVDYFTRAIDFVGDLTQEQKERMLTIANKCPVHKTLHSHPIVETFLAAGE